MEKYEVNPILFPIHVPFSIFFSSLRVCLCLVLPKFSLVCWEICCSGILYPFKFTISPSKLWGVTFYDLFMYMLSSIFFFRSSNWNFWVYFLVCFMFFSILFCFCAFFVLVLGKFFSLIFLVIILVHKLCCFCYSSWQSFCSFKLDNIISDSQSF